MFKRLSSIHWASYIYIALALSTFKHSAWAFSTTLEGPEPVIDWNTAQIGLEFAWALGAWGLWYFFGALMAVTTDVGLYFSAKSVQEFYKQKSKSGATRFQTLIMWLVYSITALVSGYNQWLYAVQHAAPVVITRTDISPLMDGGWLRTIMLWSVVILPIVLPAMSILYTLSQKVRDDTTVVLMTAPVGTDESTGENLYDVDATATMLAYHPSWVRRIAQMGRAGKKVNGKWMFTDNDLIIMKGIEKREYKQRQGRSRNAGSTSSGGDDAAG